MTIPSPCTQNCALDPHLKYCTTCGRTLPEIESWPTATDEEKRTILLRLSQSSGRGLTKDEIDKM
jgi:predicted Fe-S protein YdhL (DUF1289 family)